jgi:hypothetical protein
MKDYTQEQIEEFELKREAARLKRIVKEEEAATIAEMVASGEIDAPRRNGRQGKGEWRDGVYFPDLRKDPQAYLQLIADLDAQTPAPVDPDTAFLMRLAELLPEIARLPTEEFLTAACSILFENDPDRLLSRACQLLESLGAYRTPCGTLVTRYRRLPTTSGSSQSLKSEDLEGGIS